MIAVGSGIVAGVLASLLMANYSGLIMAAIFAGLIAFVVITWFEINRIQREKDDLDERLRKFGSAVMEDFSNLTDSINTELKTMGEEVNDSFREMWLLIMQTRHPEEGED